ncbi:MAG: metallophosphoesterase family protein [Pseudomonadota bacterium]
MTNNLKFAVLADIHGNKYALDAVLEDMSRLNLNDAVVLGDHFSGPLQAAETARTLMNLPFTFIRGNHDRYLLETNPSEMGSSDKSAFEELSGDELDWLALQPPNLRVSDEVFACHGTPSDDETYLMHRVDVDGRVIAASYSEISDHVCGISAQLILCAHTHLPGHTRLSDDLYVLNPGSVGCPAYDDTHPTYHVVQTGTPNASYAIVEQNDGNWDFSFRSVAYRHHDASALAYSRGRKDWARALATGWLGT